MSRRRAFILISALWTVAFLSVLAVTLMAGVRQRIILFKRVEARGQMQAALQAAAKKAMAILVDDIENNQFIFSPSAKQRRMNNPGEFANILVGPLRAEVVHAAPDDRTGALGMLWGVADEQGKINVNKASSEVIKRLMIEVLGWGGMEAKGLADAITDWRDYGRHQAEGFFSDDYYKNLEFPYPMKERPFERLDEILLVKGVDLEIFEALLPFITIYGDGKVNINTASKQVLLALGLDALVADKLLKARRGVDDLEATHDDLLFARPFDVAADTAKKIVLEAREARQIDELNARGLLTTESYVYSFLSRVLADDGSYSGALLCVFNALESRVLYWNEK